MLYHVENSMVSSIKLWRVDSSIFRVIQFGEFTDLMVGADYTVISKNLLPAFENLLSNEIEIKPIKIFRKATAEEWEGYYELLIKEHVDPEKIQTVDENERDVWQYEHNLFVSEALKNKLAILSEGQLEFSVGFSHFG